jgi:hypothetical protein
LHYRNFDSAKAVKRDLGGGVTFEVLLTLLGSMVVFTAPAFSGSGGRPLISGWSVDSEPVARAYELAGMLKITQNAKATFAKVFGNWKLHLNHRNFCPDNLGSLSTDTTKRNVRRRHGGPASDSSRTSAGAVPVCGGRFARADPCAGKPLRAHLRRDIDASPRKPVPRKLHGGDAD